MLLQELWQTLLDTIVDVLPIAIIIAAFQFIVIRRPVANPGRVLGGFVYVLLGLTLVPGRPGRGIVSAGPSDGQRS